jgi:hypothetical protein
MFSANHTDPSSSRNVTAPPIASLIVASPGHR